MIGIVMSLFITKNFLFVEVATKLMIMESGVMKIRYGKSTEMDLNLSSNCYRGGVMLWKSDIYIIEYKMEYGNGTGDCRTIAVLHF